MGEEVSIEEDIKASANAIADAVEKSAKEAKLLRPDALARVAVQLTGRVKSELSDKEWGALCEIMGMAINSLSILEYLVTQQPKGRTVTEEVESTGSATAH